MILKKIIGLSVFLLFSCFTETSNHKIVKIENDKIEKEQFIVKKTPQFDKNTKTIHLFVALCDNQYQGIVPVPKNIGNGQKPKTNLYWGAGYGVKTYFKRSKEWKLLSSQKISDTVLERLIFKHTSKNYYLVADAYNGKYIEQTTVDLLNSGAGKKKEILQVNNKVIGIYGNAKMLAYIGHDGLMDFSLDEKFINTDQKTRDVIILACYSKEFFKNYVKNAKMNPLIWTSGLMAPEAYTLHDALSGYVRNETQKQIQKRAAKAYSKYQKCSLRAATNLLRTGW
jgi:hypothetical protein